MKKIILFFTILLLSYSISHAKDARDIIEAAIAEFKVSKESDASSLGNHFTEKYIDIDALSKRVITRKIRAALGDKMGLVISDIQKRVAHTLGQKLKAGKDATITVKPEVRSINEDPILGEPLTVVSIIIDSTEYGKINVDLHMNDNGRIVAATIDGTFDMTTTFKKQYEDVWKKSDNNPDTFIKNLR